MTGWRIPCNYAVYMVTDTTDLIKSELNIANFNYFRNFRR